MIEIELEGLHRAAGIGVAGNFAGHLEQAGEAVDFANVVAATPDAPKGIFPWYRPGADGQLGTFPISGSRLVEPSSATPVNLQIEPEIAILFRVRYASDGRVEGLAPMIAAAFNDCSIRRPGATKISEKKNWGPASKGLAPRGFAIGDLEPDGALATLRIASFLRRDGVAHAYGIDSPAAGYSYSGRTLIAWMLDRLEHQAGAPDSPLEPVGSYLAADGRPDVAVVGIGATRYTEFGERTYLTRGDQSIVIVYDAARLAADAVAAAVADGTEADLANASVLSQAVVPPDPA
jgi:hypothetical protein